MLFSVFFHRNTYEYCKRCNANLTLQKGFDNNLACWKCRGCGEMLINPAVPSETDIAWFCDKCEAMLNTQEGFSESCGEWQCLDCGFVNKIDSSEVFLSDDEYQQHLNNPYRGLSDEDVIEIMKYEEIGLINNRPDLVIVKDTSTMSSSSSQDGKLYLKKYLSTYDLTVYEYLMNHPVAHMPKIVGMYQSEQYLIIIEEYIEGVLLSDVINQGKISLDRAKEIVRQLCVILNTLHTLDNTNYSS